ncbi:MAG: hypothetical protein SFU83_12750 [Meiothermus sp.]|nr:hypothetical protein [Meiothermus sp.]
MQTRLLTLTLLLLVAGCKEDAPQADPGPQLPPETQTGAGTLGFKIDDRIYVATTAIGELRQASDNSFAINSGNRLEQWGLSVETDSLYGTGVYRIDTLVIAPFTVAGGAGYMIADGCGFETWAVPPNVGVLTVTCFDPAARIISGRFSMTVAGKPECGQRVITDGRFDVRF